MKWVLLLLGAALAGPAYAQCTPTPSRPMGTHYEPITQESRTLGKGLVVQGRVLAAPDCRPVSGAKISHWQAGEAGRYVDRLRAYQFSGEDGGFRLETEWPGAPIPHIHFVVKAEGYQRLVTQWVGEERTDRVSFDIVLTPR